MNPYWFRASRCRCVVDMHIEDWDQRFLSAFDPEAYVEMLAISGADATVLYAHSHVGYCYYPARIGHIHAAFKGRDYLGEVIDLCRRRGIAAVIYYSLIFNTWAWRTCPEWRIITASGRAAGTGSRYGVCCPNTGYRDHVAAQIEEICGLYDFDGMRFDMTFWPGVCYCPACLKRFDREVGGEPPRVVNWLDPRWVAFQRRREAWLEEFAAMATERVHQLKPGASVEHQASTYTAPWQLGVTADLRDCNTFLQGDFYGGPLQGAFVCKLLHHLTPERPFAFETSSNITIQDHTTLKAPELIEAKAFRAAANGGAFVFIDAIDPVGTLNRRVYETMGGIFGKISACRDFIGGEFCQDAAVYLSTESKFDFSDNGQPVEGCSSRTPHVDAALGAARALIRHNIPYGVITRKELAHLSRYQVLILPDVLMMSEAEAEAVRAYVENGGSLYASRNTSLTLADGTRPGDFLLTDVFGVSWREETKESITYMAPTREGQSLLAPYSASCPLCLYSPQIRVQADGNAAVLGTLTLPFTDPGDPERFASIHSNPPGEATGLPALVFHRYGKGQVIYAAGSLESHEAHDGILARLARLLAVRPFAFDSDAPPPVEITLFHRPEEKRYIAHLLNFQQEMPNIPIEGIRLRVGLGERRALRAALLPAGQPVPITGAEGWAEMILPRLETYMAVGIEYEAYMLPE